MVLLIYGGGGHREQARRLLNYSNKEFIIEITELGIQPVRNQKVFFTPIFETKYNLQPLKLIKVAITQIKILRMVIRNYRPHKVVSTGPFIGALGIIIAYLYSIESIYIETWSRFSSKSISGRIAYLFANQFIIQNKQLQNLYPNAKYGGRL